MSVRVRIACFARGHVLGPDQALDQLELAVVADGGDAPGDGDILATVDRPGLDRGFDLVEPGLVGIGFLDQFFGPVLVVHVGECVVAGPQAFDLGLLLVRRLGRLRTHPPEGGSGAPVHVEPRLGPFPARLQFPRRDLEAVNGELVQEIGIVELDLPGAGPVALLAHRLPDRGLPRMIRGDGEGHQCFQIDLARAVGLEQHRCGVAEPQPLLHGAFRDPEAGRDGGRRASRIGQAAERLDLIGRVHGGAGTVLGQRNFFGRHDSADRAARHEVDRDGNVNVTKFGNRPNGCGGFIDITQNAKSIVFGGTLTSRGLEVEFAGGRITIANEGEIMKFVPRVAQISYSGRRGRDSGQDVTFVTERAVFRMTPEGLVLSEIAPGVRLKEDVLDRMGFEPAVSPDLGSMDPRLFREGPMGLR